MTTLLGPHRTPKGKTDTWITPKWILDCLGAFDLDPCCPPTMPWQTAARMIHQPEDGLAMEWSGRVWLNPPYSRDGIGKWMAKMAKHGDGIALVYARVDTKWGQEALYRASAVLFLEKRVTFCNEFGDPAGANAGAPSMLLAYGWKNAEALQKLPGIGMRWIWRKQ